MTGAESGPLAGTTILLRQLLRRDWWQIAAWTAGVTVLYWSQAVSVAGIYTTQAELDKAAAAMEGNAALVAMTGPARALDTIGGQVTWQATAFGAICVGLMSMFLVGRHTRSDEETGRDELLRAGAIGRLATSTAALLLAMIANVLVGAGIALSLVGYGLAVADSLALGVGSTLVGWLFAGVALLAAQLTANTRTVYAMTGGVLGLAYVLRAVGDLGTAALTWMSPIGWFQGMHAFSGVRWWPALLLAAGAATVGVAAYVVFGHRDHAAGVLAARPGPDRASASLATGWGLAWRLQRGGIVGWGAGLLLFGLAYGSLGNDVGDVIGDSEATRELMAGNGSDLVAGFYGTALLMLAMLACGFAISSALRPRGEEDAHRLESLLATALPRRRWLLGHVAMTVGGVILVLAAGGVGLGVGYGLTANDWSDLTTYVLGGLQYAGPVLVLAGLARLLTGFVPRLATLAWAGLAFAVVVMFFGPLLDWPRWVQEASPFTHLALVPAEDFRPAPLLALLAIAAALSAAGQLAFARRDVHT